MCKKLTIAAVAVVLGLLVLGGTQVGPKIPGYLAVWWNKADTAVAGAIPLETEIDRIELEVKKLDEDIKASRTGLLQEEVALERLTKEINIAQAGLDKQEAVLARMHKDLESGVKTISYNGKDFSADQVRVQFARDWESFEAAQEALKARRGLLEQKKTHLLNSAQKVKEMETIRTQMLTEVSRLRTELETARLAQAQSAAPTDNSRLAGIKSDMSKVEDQIKLLKKEAEAQGAFVNPQVPVAEELKTKESLDRAKAYFGGKKNDVAVNP